jgi:glycosyltransferase involved in cell wall biosynthesis
VQVSRDTTLLWPSPGSEPVERQLGYARELNRRAPGSIVTILVLTGNEAAEGWRHENLQIIPSSGPLRGALRSVQTLHAIHKAAPISVITTQVPNDEAWLILAAAYWNGIPVIGQIHSDLFAEHVGAPDAASIKRALHRWATRRTCGAFAAIRTVSSECRSSIARFAAHVPLTTIPVPVPLVGGRARIVPQPKPPLVIFVGRLAPEKDLTTWLKVACAVSQRHPDTRFEIVGDGPEGMRLQQEAQRLGLRGVVSFAGFVPYARLREVYARATVLLLTSRAEGFGRVLIEAASQGTPAVSTSLAGPRDIIINGVTGFLHEPGDVEALARSVSALVRQPQRAALMGASARALVAVRFDPDRLCAEWVDLWVDTATGRRRVA